MKKYAGFWKRFAAYLIDAVILNISAFIVTFIAGFVYIVSIKAVISKADIDNITPYVYILSIVIVWLYYAFMESSSKQATLGKMILGIKVTGLSGEKISFKIAAGRFFAKIPSGLIFGIGYMMAGWTEKKQALHDMLADTLVVNSGNSEQK